MTATTTGKGRPRRRPAGTRVSREPVLGNWVKLPPAVARWVRPILSAVVTVAVIGILAAYVFPTRTWLEQREALAETGAALDELEAERDALSARIDELDSDEEIESIARSQFGLVMPGEEAYSVLPAPAQPIDLPEIWPYGDVDAPASVAEAVPVTPPAASP